MRNGLGVDDLCTFDRNNMIFDRVFAVGSVCSPTGKIGSRRIGAAVGKYEARDGLVVDELCLLY